DAQGGLGELGRVVVCVSGLGQQREIAVATADGPAVLFDSLVITSGEEMDVVAVLRQPPAVVSAYGPGSDDGDDGFVVVHLGPSGFHGLWGRVGRQRQVEKFLNPPAKLGWIGADRKDMVRINRAPVEGGPQLHRTGECRG